MRSTNVRNFPTARKSAGDTRPVRVILYQMMKRYRTVKAQLFLFLILTPAGG